MIAKTQEEQIEKFRALRELLKKKGIAVGLIADEWCNTLADIKLFADTHASDFVQIKTPDLGGINNTIEAVLYCKSHGMGACLGGTANETDQSTHLDAHRPRLPARLHAVQARARRRRSADDPDQRDGAHACDPASAGSINKRVNPSRTIHQEIPMSIRLCRLVALAVIALSAAAVPLSGSAQTGFPAKPVRIIVPFSPGGAADFLPRLVGAKLSEMWGQPVVVENRTGAAGNIGMELGARAAPDGYTLTSAPVGNLAINPHLYSKLAYDVFRDFTPVTLVASVQNVLVVHPSIPARSVQELIALARTQAR